MSLMRKTGFLALATTWLAALIPAMAQNNGQSPANAIWIRDADSAARQPVQFTQTVNTSYYWDAETVYTVPAGKLLVIESVIPPGNDPFGGKLLDLVMLLIPGGKERTADEYTALFDSAGFKLTRIVPTTGEISVIEAIKS